jgi:predicted O-linked N-acetylglucosamine transferase (SPINDLY family)
MVKTKNNTNPTLEEMNALLALFTQRKFPEALALASTMAEHYPKHGFAWKVLGAVYQNQGAVDHALQALKNAAKLLPDDYEVQYNLGNCFYDQQQLDSAVVCYKKAIQLNPSFAQAYYNLGSVYKGKGLFQLAETSYQEALKLEPNNVPMCLNLAQLYYEKKDYVKALDNYQAVAVSDADNIHAMAGLGVTYKALGLLDNAEECYRKLIEIAPSNSDVYSNLGILLKDTNRLDEAELSYQKAIQLNPECVPAYNNLGLLYKSKGDFQKAGDYYRLALNIDPLNPVAYNNLAVVLRDAGQYVESEANCRKSIEIRPQYADPYNNLGLALDSQGRYDEAIKVFEQALHINPEDASILSNFSVTLVTKGQLEKAEACLKKALEIAPNFINLYINLCITYLAQGRPKEAEVVCLKALDIQPDCLAAKGNLLFSMNYTASHTVDECFAQAVQYNTLVTKNTDKVYTSWLGEAKPERLKVGIVSADMRQHAVAFFLENVVKHIDTKRVELVAYSADGREDIVTQRLKKYFSVWRNIAGLNDKSAAELIWGDAIHVLIDLSGHSEGGRLPVFARKPAPVQVSWLGYFATTGLDAMDYFVADEVGLPRNMQHHFTEKIYYLPNTRLCFSVPDVSLPVADLPALNNGYITFGCFQNMAKIGNDVLLLWSQVLKQVPNAKLRLQNKALGDPVVLQAVMDRIVACGINKDSVLTYGLATREDYFAAHADVDMILDTFPFNGGTTTCEALWMGVPTLTLAGDRLIARQGASLLSAAGLADWVVNSADDFVAKGVAFASDISQLAKLRAGLREQVLASPLFDGQLFAHHMEKALWQMSGLTPPKFLDIKQVNQAESSHKNQKTIQATELESLDVVTISDSNRPLLIVSATRSSEQEFWSHSALGVSLKKHMALDGRLSANVAFENTRGLSEVFNEGIEKADGSAILVFIHDDVWIDEANFVDAVISGLKTFDVIGVAGNKRRVANQPAWAFIDNQFTWDESANLSGRVAHGQEAFGYINDYGAVPAACELMDGVFLAAKKSTLLNANVKFDPQFDFHFYDLDFCRSARLAGLKLGTWLVNLTHQSGGAFGSAGWVSKYQLYLDKWERVPSKDTELQQAINHVLQLAIDHHQAGRLEQAAMLYEEILKIQANHPEANHRLGLIEVNTKGDSAALIRLELAVQAAPECEQYWVSFIQSLMQVGAIDTAVNALELGQKFGLKPETAQSLAAGFIQAIDSK